MLGAPLSRCCIWFGDIIPALWQKLTIDMQVKKQCFYLQASRGQFADMGADKRWVSFHAGAKLNKNASALFFVSALAYL